MPSSPRMLADERIQSGAYVHDAAHIWQVTYSDGETVWLEALEPGLAPLVLPIGEIVADDSKYELVKSAEASQRDQQTYTERELGLH